MNALTLDHDQINVYQADINDIENIIEIEIESHQHETKVMDQALNTILLIEYKKRWLHKLQSGMKILIMKMQEQYVGFIAYSITREVAEIHNIYVISTLRRRKLGRLLCTNALEKMMKHATSKVCVWLVEGRMQIIRFYENMGFIATSQARVDRINDDLSLVEKKYEMIINH